MSETQSIPGLTAQEQRELENWFAYHPPTPELIAQYNYVRDTSKALAEWIMVHIPASADRTAALRSLRGTVMAINLAIACNQPKESP